MFQLQLFPVIACLEFGLGGLQTLAHDDSEDFGTVVLVWLLSPGKIPATLS